VLNADIGAKRHSYGCKFGVWASILARVVVLVVVFLSQYFYRSLSRVGFCLISGVWGFIWQWRGDGGRLFCFLLCFYIIFMLFVLTQNSFVPKSVMA
jgi:transposase